MRRYKISGRYTNVFLIILNIFLIPLNIKTGTRGIEREKGCVMDDVKVDVRDM